MIAASALKHIGMSLRVKQTECRRGQAALAPVLDECRAIGKPGLSPNGTHFDVASADSLGLSGFLRF